MSIAFGPSSFRVARLLIASKEPSFIGRLDEVAAAWPGLSFDDFRGGYILADALLRHPEHIRSVAEGAAEPGDDPLRWLDEAIASCTPPLGSA
jgi:hypothetical protein